MCFFSLRNYLKKNGGRLFRCGVIILLLLFITYKNLGYVLNYQGTIDVFHLGEKISPSISLMFLGKKPIIDIFALHGYFLEVIESVISFRLFGVSIGSYLFFDMLLNIVSYGLFLLLASLNIKNNILFFLTSIFFIGTQLRLRIVNNIPFFVFLILSSLMLKRKKTSFVLYVLQAVLIFTNFFYATEQAYYGILALFIYCCIQFALIYKSSSNAKLNMIVKMMSSYILGLFVSLVLGSFLLSPSGLKQLILDLFFIPKVGYTIFSRNFPPLSLRYFFPFYLPFVIAVFNLFFLIYLIVKGRLKSVSFNVLIFVVGIAYFESIFARSDVKFLFYDTANTNYFMWPLFLSSFMVIDALYKYTTKRKATVLLFVLSTLIAPFFIPQYLIFPQRVRLVDIKKVFDLPRCGDDFWISPEQRKVSSFIKKNTTLKDYIYVFNDESLYYYLTRRPNPSRYFLTVLAQPEESQKYLIEQLKKNRPKYIVYHSHYWSNDLDGIPQSTRLKDINKWILENYHSSIKIDSTTLLF